MSNDPNQNDAKREPKPGHDLPPAGPHDRPGLTDDHKTPGSGVLPDEPAAEVEGPTG